MTKQKMTKQKIEKLINEKKYHKITFKDIKQFVTFVRKNMKVDVDNISLPPGITCDPSIQCIKKCYALKSYRIYPSVRKAYTKNLETFLSDPEFFFNLVNVYIKKRNQKYFRWQVSGDIVNKKYLQGMIEVARKNPSVKFLAFSKKYNICIERALDIPKNLKVILSSWIDAEMPKHNFSIAWYQDGTEKRAENFTVCGGSCYNCKKCWNLKEDKNVLFHSH